MTHHVLFVQGGGEGAHDKWDNKLVESLERELGPDYAVHYPRMPHEADPRYAAWKAALQREFDRLDDGAILIGHSIGGTILIRTLADEPPKLTFAGIFLIAAPFVGDGGWQSEDIEPLSDLVPGCLNRRRFISFTASRTKRPRSGTFTSTRKPFRKLSCADSLAATISSITTCQKSPPISGA